MPRAFEPVSAGVEALGSKALDAAFAVHRELGPGLLESVYEACVCRELQALGVNFQRQVAVPVRYRDITLEAGLRLDVLVGGHVILELKAVESVLPIHEAQLMTYLRLTGCRLGFLINFNVRMLRDGIKRVVI